jgi:hypothetical protein
MWYRILFFWDMMLHRWVVCFQFYGVEQRRKQPTFCVNAKPWLHSDIFILAPLSWIQRMLGVSIWVRSRTSAKEQGYHNLASDYEAQRACPKAWGALGPKGLKPYHYSILTHPILSVMEEYSVFTTLGTN